MSERTTKPRTAGVLACAALLLALGCGSSSSPGGARAGGPSAAAPASGADRCGAPRRRIASIGIDAYAHHRDLQNAEADADRVARLLHTRFGFEVHPPLRGEAATPAGVAQWLVDLERALADRVGCPRDHLVVYYAGHGHHKATGPTGDDLVPRLVLPADAPAEVTADGRPVPAEYDVGALLDALDAMPVMHVTVVLDACSMGLALGEGVRAIEPYDTLTETADVRRSRKLIAAAGFLQDAHDAGLALDSRQGPLVDALIDGLEGGHADLYADGVVTFSELGIYLQAEVSRDTDWRQIPEFGGFGRDGRAEPPLFELARVPDTPVDARTLREMERLDGRVRRAVDFDRYGAAARALERLLRVRDAVGRRIRRLSLTGHLAEQRGEWAAAQAAFTEALDLRRRLSPTGHPAIAALTQRVAELAERTDPSEAEVWRQATVDAWAAAFRGRVELPAVAATLGAAARWSFRAGRADVAVALLDAGSTVELARRDPLAAAQMKVNRGVVLAASGDRAAGVASAEEGVALARAQPGAPKGRVVELMRSLSAVQEAAGRPEAAAATRRAIGEVEGGRVEGEEADAGVVEVAIEAECRSDQGGCESGGSNEAPDGAGGEVTKLDCGAKREDAIRFDPPNVRLATEVLDARLVFSTPSGHVANPRWSPDGRQLAIHLSGDDGTREVRIVKFSSDFRIRRIHRVTVDSDPVYTTPITDFTWAPDMKLLAKPYIFASVISPGSVRHYDLYVDRVWLTRYVPGSQRQPAWSPDGRFIAYVSAFRGADLYLFDLAAVSVSPRAITSTPDVVEFDPVWSPQNILAFSRWHTSDELQTTIALTTDMEDASRTTCVLVDWVGTNTRPSWSPDGTRVAFFSDAEEPHAFGLWVVDADGRNPRRLAMNAHVDTPVGDLLDPSRSRPVWTPDGRHILFTGDNPYKRIMWVAVDGAAMGEMPTGTFNNDGMVLHGDGANVYMAFTGRDALTEDAKQHVYLTSWTGPLTPAP